jgi:hypothetical protein
LTFGLTDVLYLFMSRNPEKQARAEQILGELAELGLVLAREVAVAAREAEDPQEKAALVQAFQKTARTVRLTLALDAKLDRQAAQDAKEAAREAQAAEADEFAAEFAAECAEDIMAPIREAGPVERQKRRVRNLFNRLLWNECEGDSEEHEMLGDELDARLEEAARAPGFADLPLEVVATRLAADMRLTGELVVTTAQAFTPEALTPANAAPPPLADTG